MTQALEIGVRALQAHNRAMEVTSHNIANAATPGFSRQRADLTTSAPLSVTPGQLGRGVELAGVVRISDKLLVERLRAAQADGGRFQTLAKTLTDVELVFNEPNDTGFASVIGTAFAALEDLSNNPELSSLRAGTVQNLRTFASTLNDLGGRLRQQAEDLRQVISDEVVQVNSLIDRIVQLNIDIGRQVTLQRNPNDLMDRRDLLLKELSTHVDARVGFEPGTNAALVEIAGRSVISQTNGIHLGVEELSEGRPVVVLADSQEAVSVTGGSIGGYLQIGQEILPQMRSQLDELTTRLAGRLNNLHATGTSHLAQVGTHLSQTVFDQFETDLDLDDLGHIKAENALDGVPEAYLADFTDGNGTYVPRNLTINALDPSTGVAEKFIVRYDPGTAPRPASRSLEDLAAAINTGRGGGFSVEPPYAGGVDHVRARLISVDGGIRLELQSPDGHHIDFSQSLDNRPARTAWSGAPVEVAGSDLALADQRLVFAVNGSDLEAYTIDPATGNHIPYGSVAIGALPAAIGGFNVTLPGGGSLVDGQRFAIDLNQTGTPLGGNPVTRGRAWVTGDAGFQVAGRYTGGHSFDPARPWTMRVVQGGSVGSDSNAPIVEFTYYGGPDDGRVQERLSIALDENYPPGSQVPVAEGVYVVFDEGDLSTGGDGVELVIDGQPDQAGLLTTLGVNAMFTGHSAETLAVAKPLLADPNRLAVARSRAAGDNTNVLAMASVRQERLMEDGRVTIDDYYQTMVSDIGVRVQQAEGLSENQDQVVRSLENRRDEVAGVNIDEQIGNLIMQQQAYTAAARIITMARDNINTLMDIFR